MRTTGLIGAILAAALCTGPASADDVRRLAVFDMTFVNFSQEVDYGATNEAELARITMLSDYLRELLQDSGRYELVDLSAAEQDLKLHGSVFTCNRCEEKMARKLSAESSITGAVNKVSQLVQTVVLRERDADSGQVIRLYQTDIRGNTDEAWRRGLEFLVKNRLFAP